MKRLLALAGSAIDAIKINATCEHVRDGRSVLFKRRRLASGFVVKCANLFFQLARQPVSVCSRADRWQHWEVSSFQRLHGDGTARREGGRTVCVEKLPGRSIAEHFVEGTFEEEMIAAAARELRRAHALWCDEFGGSWSHGDANLANFLYDEQNGRARLIDFEVVHARTLPEAERHADDLLVFLQDLLGCIKPDRWQHAALLFIETYDRPRIVRELKSRLVVPRGVPLLWWIIRANYIPPRELRRRIAELRQALSVAEQPAAVPQPSEFCAAIHSRTG